MMLNKIVLFAALLPSVAPGEFLDAFLDQAGPRLMASGATGCLLNMFGLAASDPAARLGIDRAPSIPGTHYDLCVDLYTGANDDRLLKVLIAECPGLARCDAYAVTEISRIDHAPPYRAKGRSPGLKFMPLVLWRTGIAGAQARDRWRQHVATVRWAHPSTERYLQNWVERPLTPQAPRLDAFASLHCPDLASFEDRFYAGRAGYEAAMSDVQDYIAAIPSRHYAAEYVVAPPPGSRGLA
jgi:hypothetical protein